MISVHRSVSREAFARIAKGKQTEVYHKFTPRFIRTFCSKRNIEGCKSSDCYHCWRYSVEDWTAYPYNSITLHNGKNKMTCEVTEVRWGYGRPAWGCDPESLYFVFKLGKILDIQLQQ